MAKQGMRRPDAKEAHGTESNHKQRFNVPHDKPVPEIQGNAKADHEKASDL